MTLGFTGGHHVSLAGGASVGFQQCRVVQDDQGSLRGVSVT